MGKLLNIWRASFTRRWHTNADMCDISDPVSGHQGRVALLAATYWPDDMVLIKACLLHDMAEAYVADVPSHVKKECPELRDLLHTLEAKAMADMGIVFPRLSAEQAARLYFCDQLDALMWAAHHKPDILKRPDWQRFSRFVKELGDKLGVSYELPSCYY